MAYKVFTNGSPLGASDLNTYLMNQSVMVFANSTARSAALTAPTEGMVTYLEDTNKVEVYTGSPLAWTDINDNSGAIPKSTVTTAGDLIVADGNASVTRLGIGANGSIPRVASGSLGYLPIGTNGQVLSVSSGAPTWTTPTASGGMTLLSTTTLSGSSVVVSSISQDYKDLYILITGASCGTSGSVRVYPRVGATQINAFMSGTEWPETGTTAFRNWSFWGTSYSLVANNTNNGFAFVLRNYTASNQAHKPIEFAATWQGDVSGTGRRIWAEGGGGLNSTTSGAIDQLEVTHSISFNGGTLKIYGVN